MELHLREVAMVAAWFWIWLIFVFLLLVIPVAYGWGFRGWGPPYPWFYRRRRTLAAPQEEEAAGDGRVGWGVGADALWVALLIAVVWLIVMLYVV